MPVQTPEVSFRESSPMTISILSLHTYPVKSCAGLTHTQISISAAGLNHDRQWVVVDDEGHFLTQRQYPRMALVQPTLDETALFLNAPEMPTLRISLAKAESEPPAVPIRIWKSDTTGADEGDMAAQWFSDYLGLRCRLYRSHRNAQRLADPQRVAEWRKRQPEGGGFPLEHAFGFADGFPFLVTNQGSLDELNQRLAAQATPPVPMNRFRPNIVIQGLSPYEEDYVSSLHIGSMVFAVVKRCSRCPMPNVDAATAAVGTEPMATLTDYRHFEEGVLFGVNAVVGGAGRDAVLSVGERVEATLDL
ncbi:MOSC N-terminal beta barrel domain-containing protein [Alcaligenaceae bacterium]|nr:MOSC N-terminal beta barrel domain-containing protein [Alcaligenaceae bacterium]